MTTSFTPRTIIKKRRYQLLAGLLLIALASSTTYYLTLPNTSNAATTYTWSTNTDLALGTTASTTVNTSPDSVTLSLKGSPVPDTTEEQFLLGSTPLGDPYSTLVQNQAGGEVVLKQDLLFTYNTTNVPELSRNWVRHSFLSNNLLYLTTITNLSVINTQGTIDPSDDVFITSYYSGSNPGLGIEDTWVNHTSLNDNLLYISTESSGLSVINTQGTIDPSDDTLVTRYHTSSTPALGSNYVDQTFLAGSLLYVSTNAGLSVINTQGTTDPSDDALVTTYSTSSTPSLVDDGISHSFLAGNLLYVTNNGLSVINTQGTTDPSDDVLVTRYHTGSTPALGSNSITNSFLAGDLLYVSTNAGLSVINTQGTTDPSDDALVTTYNTSSNPALGSNYVHHSFLDNNLLYLSTDVGLSVINTQGTTAPGDDTLVITYNTESDPTLVHSVVHHFFLDPFTQFLYLSGPSGGFSPIPLPGIDGAMGMVPSGTGLSIIDLNGNFAPTASFQSQPRVITDTPTEAFSFDRTLAAGNSVSIQYRTGDSEAVWINNFDDATTTEYLGDFYAWGSTFNDVTESGGTMKLSNPDSGSWTDTWIDTVKPDDYFPLGSKVKARIRINSDTVVGIGVCIFNDDWWDDDGCPLVTTNEWFTTSFVAVNKTFSKIGLSSFWDNGTWAPTDTFEIDWLQIELPESAGHWNAWSTPCTDNTSCPIDQADLVGNEWIQYKLNLTTSDPHTTPSVNSVTWMSGYESGGAYTSNTKSFNQSQDLLTFDASADTPTGTSIAYAYTVNGGQTWLPITPGAQFPRGTTAESFAWKATLTSTNPLVTPTINSITITTVTHEENTTTSTNVAVRVANLEAQGRQAEADALREKYSNNQLSDADVKREIIIILNKVITILKRLAELEG